MMAFKITCDYSYRELQSYKLLWQVGYRCGQYYVMIQDVNDNRQNVTDGRSALLHAQPYEGSVVSPTLSRYELKKLQNDMQIG